MCREYDLCSLTTELIVVRIIMRSRKRRAEREATRMRDHSAHHNGTTSQAEYAESSPSAHESDVETNQKPDGAFCKSASVRLVALSDLIVHRASPPGFTDEHASEVQYIAEACIPGSSHAYYALAEALGIVKPASLFKCFPRR